MGTSFDSMIERTIPVHDGELVGLGDEVWIRSRSNCGRRLWRRHKISAIFTRFDGTFCVETIRSDGNGYPVVYTREIEWSDWRTDDPRLGLFLGDALAGVFGTDWLNPGMGEDAGLDGLELAATIFLELVGRRESDGRLD